MLMMCNDILIESEGFVFKQLADLWFLANALEIMGEKSVAQRCLTKITKFLLLSVVKDGLFVIIFLRAHYGAIKARCIARKCHIEPARYVEFQDSLYGKIVTAVNMHSPDRIKVININADQSINDVHLEIFSKVKQYICTLSK